VRNPRRAIIIAVSATRQARSSEDEVVALTRGHLRSEHPELLDAVTLELIRGWVEVVS
jgi:hypothetical protein